MTTMQTRFEEIVDRAEQQGWTYQKTTQGHHKLLAPDGIGVVVTAGTPSDHRSILNFEADMRRHGYKPYSEREELMEKRHQRKKSAGLQKAIEKLITSHPDLTFDASEISVRLGSQFPGAKWSQALTALHNRGAIVRVAHGQYKAPRPEAPPVKVALPTPEPRPQSDDERILDEALAALGHIEKVVRKYKGIIRQMQTAFKELPND